MRAGLYKRRFFFSGVFFDRFGSQFSEFAAAAEPSHADSNMDESAAGAAATGSTTGEATAFGGNSTRVSNFPGVEDNGESMLHFRERRLGVPLVIACTGLWDAIVFLLLAEVGGLQGLGDARDATTGNGLGNTSEHDTGKGLSAIMEAKGALRSVSCNMKEHSSRDRSGEKGGRGAAANAQLERRLEIPPTLIPESTCTRRLLRRLLFEDGLLEVGDASLTQISSDSSACWLGGSQKGL